MCRIDYSFDVIASMYRCHRKDSFDENAQTKGRVNGALRHIPLHQAVRDSQRTQPQSLSSDYKLIGHSIFNRTVSTSQCKSRPKGGLILDLTSGKSTPDSLIRQRAFASVFPPQKANLDKVSPWFEGAQIIDSSDDEEAV